jgi:hypothetical protein
VDSAILISSTTFFGRSVSLSAVITSVDCGIFRSNFFFREKKQGWRVREVREFSSVLRRGKWYVHKKRYLRLDLIIRSGSCGAETPVYVRCVYLEKFLFALSMTLCGFSPDAMAPGLYL